MFSVEAKHSGNDLWRSHNISIRILRLYQRFSSYSQSEVKQVARIRNIEV
ncbi:hypothetical protein [Anabaena lutea]|nr:hypothetical protein [Anabaena lutea]